METRIRHINSVSHVKRFPKLIPPRKKIINPKGNVVFVQIYEMF